MTRIELSVAALLLGGYALFLVAIFGAVWVRASKRQREAAEAESVAPQVREALVEYLAGSNLQTRIREFVASHRSAVADGILSFQGTVAGSARDRMCDLALDLNLVHEWCKDAQSRDPVARRTAYARLAFVCAYEPCRRVAGDLLAEALHDDDREVRLPAARALVQAGNIQEIGQVFQIAVSQSMLIRILLTEDLRRHAPELCESVVPEALKSRDSRELVPALQILVAWERALPLSGVLELLQHRDREVRIEALRLAPLVPPAKEIQSAVLRDLTDPDPELSTVAALSAGRMRLQEAMASLARCVRTGTAELARIAAAALAEMPPRGWQTLQELAGGPNPTAAAISSQALARARQKAGV